MKPRRTEDLVELGGELVVGAHRPLGAISIDSRAVSRDGTFFCIRGPRFDGHDFAWAAADAGVGVVVCELGSARRIAGTLAGRATVVAVPDTVRALGLLGARHRTRFGGVVVGVTGSSGKTTTKELIAAVLATAGQVHKTAGNLNNHLGLPLTLLGLTAVHRYAVLEMGMSAPGEIALLAELAHPAIGVITSVGVAHLESLKTVEAIAQAKGELLQALPANGLAVIPSDVAWPWVLTRGLGAALVAVGTQPTDEIRLTAVREGQRGATGTVHVDGQALPLRLRLAGEHNLRNALLAIAVGRAVGVSPGAAVEALAEVHPPAMRGEIRRLADGTPVVLDCYNANPLSMRASLEAFVRRAPAGIVILGDMLELGPSAREAHVALGQLLPRLSSDLALIAVGSHAEDVADAARAGGLRMAVAVGDADAAAGVLHDRRLDGRPILLKGSRGVRLERVFALLTASSAAAARSAVPTNTATGGEGG